MSTSTLSHVSNAINTFWFGGADDDAYGQARPEWFVKNPDFDAEIKQRFETTMSDAALGTLDAMAQSPEGAVALVVVLDQFPRNVYRNDARAFAQDAKALSIAKVALDEGFNRDIIPVMRSFLYLPFEHSENLADQDRAVKLFTRDGNDGGLAWAIKHRDIIAEFGRFPHRNAILGRENTPQEARFLTQPGSSF